MQEPGACEEQPVQAGKVRAGQDRGDDHDRQVDGASADREQPEEERRAGFGSLPYKMPLGLATSPWRTR